LEPKPVKLCERFLQFGDGNEAQPRAAQLVEAMWIFGRSFCGSDIDFGPNIRVPAEPSIPQLSTANPPDFDVDSTYFFRPFGR